jgi:hypothetical protein
LCVPNLRAQASEHFLPFWQKENAQWCPDSRTCDFQNTGATESKLAAVCVEHSEDGYLPAGVHAAFGLQPPIFARCMHFKALLLRVWPAPERRQVFTVSINWLRPALRSVGSCPALLSHPLLKIKLIIIFGYFVPRAWDIQLHLCIKFLLRTNKWLMKS